jgi:AraC-like DNA-binding protein
MNQENRNGNEALLSIPFPLKNLDIELSATSWETQRKCKTYSKGSFTAKQSTPSQGVDYSFLKLGEIGVLVARSTPYFSWEEDDAGTSSLTMCLHGSHCHRDGTYSTQINSGNIFVNPRNGGKTSIGYIASINFPLEHKRLDRIIRSMNGEVAKDRLQSPWIFGQQEAAKGGDGASSLFAIFNFIDNLLLEGAYLATGLSLDDQIYRLLALSLFQAEGKLEEIESRWRFDTSNWTNRLDDLVDYIHQNAHLNLTLTDLEEQSHYSGRHLQNMFKEKFDCTPMQFVRRQRLSAAMEKLQTADLDDTVTTIARDMGYRYTSNFSCDFQREFGVSPSVVLRSSRGGGGHGNSS